jgi:hypothetical protein
MSWEQNECDGKVFVVCVAFTLDASGLFGWIAAFAKIILQLDQNTSRWGPST